MKNSTQNNPNINREKWLEKATKLLLPFFEEQGASFKNVKVSCGFAYASKKAVGQCWQDSASAGKYFEIFISPELEDPSRVLDVLIHELCHASLPAKEGHSRRFKELAYSLGLAGRATATTAGDDFNERYQGVLQKLGDYPHAKLNTGKKIIGGKPKQTTRLLKAICYSCAYSIRLTKFWAQKGMPTCPCGDKFELIAKED